MNCSKGNSDQYTDSPFLIPSKGFGDLGYWTRIRPKCESESAERQALADPS